MSKIPLEPHQSPETQVYEYLQKLLNSKTKLNYKGANVPFLFEFSKQSDVYPQVRLEFIRHKPSTNLRYIGDSMKVINTETGNFEKVSIGEPFEAIWAIVAEAVSRDAVYNLMQQVRAKIGIRGCQKDPVYIEYSRETRYDQFVSNSLYKDESEETRFIGKIGLRTYMRLSGGIPDPTYEPRPPIEQIVLSLEVDEKIKVEEVLKDE